MDDTESLMAIKARGNAYNKVEMKDELASQAKLQAALSARTETPEMRNLLMRGIPRDKAQVMLDLSQAMRR